MRARLARFTWTDIFYYLWVLTLLAWDVREMVPSL